MGWVSSTLWRLIRVNRRPSAVPIRRLILPALLVAATGGVAGVVRTGQGALGDWTTDRPGLRRRITPADMPAPYATRSVDNGPRLVRRPANAWPRVPPGFKVQE